MTQPSVTDEIEERESNNDTGYYTPKNILNPAMFRLAEITRALSEVNMEVEHEKYLDEQEQKRHTIINTLEVCSTEENENKLDFRTEVEPLQCERFETNDYTTEKKSWFQENKDDIGKLLLFALSLSIGLFLVLLCFSWPE